MSDGIEQGFGTQGQRIGGIRAFPRFNALLQRCSRSRHLISREGHMTFRLFPAATLWNND
jgi:hypothetical protein